MDKFYANTVSIMSNINILKNYKRYFSVKKNTFSSGSYGSSGCAPVSNYLRKIQQNYESISNNTEKVTLYLEDYKNDIEGVEKSLSGLGGGVIKANAAHASAMKYKNTLSKFSVKEEDIFEVNLFKATVKSPQTTDFLDFVKQAEKNIVKSENFHSDDYYLDLYNQWEKLLNSQEGIRTVDEAMYNDLVKGYKISLQRQMELCSTPLEQITQEIDKFNAITIELDGYYSNILEIETRTDQSLRELASQYQKGMITDAKILELGIGNLRLPDHSFHLTVDEMVSILKAKDLEVKEQYEEIENLKLELNHLVQEKTEFKNYDEFHTYITGLENDKSCLIATINQYDKSIQSADYVLMTLLSDYQNYTNKTDIVTPLEKYEQDSYKFLDTAIINLSRASVENPELAKMYNYLYENKGESAAKKYLETMEDTINQINGQMSANAFLSGLKDEEHIGDYVLNHLKTATKATGDGVESYFEGLAAWFNSSKVYTENEYETMYILQALTEPNNKYTSGLSSNYEMFQSVGNMLPSITLSIVLGGTGLGEGAVHVISAGSMGASAGGNSYHGALVEGYSTEQSLFYGLCNGLSEAGLEYVLGGISGISDFDVVDFGTWLFASGNESIEEGSQAFIDALMRKVIFGEEINWSDTTKDAIKSGAYGAVTAGMINGVTVGGTASVNKLSNVLSSSMNAATQMSLFSSLVSNNQNSHHLFDLNNVGGIKLEDLKYNTHNLLESVSNILESNLKKYVYQNTNNFSGLNQEIMQNGLYYFTDAVDKIIDSGYIKPSGLNASYGNPKTFFFNGVPEVGTFATNLDVIPLVTTALKINPSEDVINSSKLKIRHLDDGAISYDGKFNLANQDVSKTYFVLKKVNDELVYKPVSQDIYENYKNTAEGKEIQEFLNNKKNVKVIKDNYLSNLFSKDNNLLQNVNDTSGLKLGDYSYAIKSLKKSTGRISKLMYGGLFSVGGIIAMSFGPLGIAIGVPPFLIGLKASQDALTNNSIKNSFLMTSDIKIKTPNGKEKITKLYQNSLAYNDFLKSRFTDNHQEYFLVRSLNAFQQLENNKKYGTRSQANTYMLLKKMQQLGYIKNITKTRVSTDSNLALERFLLGVKDKKNNIRMYDMTFETTDKKIDSNGIYEILKTVQVDLGNYNIKLDSKGNTILDLNLTKKIKDTIIKRENEFRMNTTINTKENLQTNHNLNSTKENQNNALFENVKDAFIPGADFSDYTDNIELLQENAVVEEFSPEIRGLLEEWHGFKTRREQDLFIVNKLTDDSQVSIETKKEFLKQLIETGEINDLENGTIFNMMKDEDLLHGLVYTSRIEGILEKNLVKLSHLIVPTLSKLSYSEFNQIFNSEKMKAMFNSVSFRDFFEIMNSFVKNNFKFEYILSNETFMDKLSSLSTEEFNKFIQKYGYNIGESLRNLSKETEIPATYDKFLENVADHIYTEEYLLKHPKFRSYISVLLSGFASSNHTTEASIKLNQILNNINDTLNQNIQNNSLIPIEINGNSFKTNVEKSGWYDIEVEIFGDTLKYTKEAQEPIFQGSNYISLDFLMNDAYTEYAFINGNAKIKSITWNERKSTLFFSDLPNLVKVNMSVDGKNVTQVYETLRGRLDLTSIFKEDQKIENIQITEVESYNINIDSTDNNIYKLKGLSNGELVDFYVKTDGKNLNMLDIDHLVLKYNLHDLHDVQIEKVSLQDIDTSIYNIMNYKTANQIFNSDIYGGNQSNARSLFMADSLSKSDSLKVEDLKKIMRQYYPTITDEEMIKVVSRYEIVGCAYVSLANALVTYFDNMENGTQIFKERFGYDLYYEEKGIKNYNFDTIALECFLSSNRFQTVAEVYGRGDGLSNGVRKTRYTKFLEPKGIHLDFSNIDTNYKYTDAVTDMLQCAKDLNTFYFMYSENFDLNYLEGRLSLSNDGALQNAKIDGSQFENIGPHAMIITDFNQAGEFTVSSWNKKFKYSKDSLEKYKNKKGTNLVIESITFNIE